MLLLTSTSDLIQVITGSSGAINVHASWVDNASGVITPGRTNTATIGTNTTTTVVASPAASTQRNVKLLSVFNASATVSNAITIQHTDGTNVEPLWKGTLAPGEAVVFDDAGDWHYANSNGVEYSANAYPPILFNSSTSTVSSGYSSDTYLAGSGILLPSGVSVAGIQYVCEFDMVKTAAGTAAAAVNIRFGTAGTTADASVCAMTFAVGTAAIDTGKFTVVATFRSAGSGTSAVVAGSTMCNHALAATGLITTGASGTGQITTVGSGFNSTPANSTIGVSFNGGTSFSGTCNYVQARLFNYRG